jgi:hypothetical protein
MNQLTLFRRHHKIVHNMFQPTEHEFVLISSPADWAFRLAASTLKPLRSCC